MYHRHAEVMPFVEYRVTLAPAFVCPIISEILTKIVDPNAYIIPIARPLKLVLRTNVKTLAPELAAKMLIVMLLIIYLLAIVEQVIQETHSRIAVQYHPNVRPTTKNNSVHTHYDFCSNYSRTDYESLPTITLRTQQSMS